MHVAASKVRVNKITEAGKALKEKNSCGKYPRNSITVERPIAKPGRSDRMQYSSNRVTGMAAWKHRMPRKQRNGMWPTKVSSMADSKSVIVPKI